VVGAVEEAVVRQPLESHSLLRSVPGWRRVELRRAMSREQAAQRCLKATRMLEQGPKVYSDLKVQAQSAPQVAKSVPVLTTCSCILRRKAVRQEAERRRG